MKDGFNPRPRAGGDWFCSELVAQAFIVSIHAPAQGATQRLVDWPHSVLGFNPRPRAGGDGIFPDVTDLLPCFNPRPRAGGDKALGRGADRPIRFQATPPRRGRPHTRPSWLKASISFNQRPRAGGDRIWHSIPITCISFNPRPRAGGDNRILQTFLRLICFNPRPRAGGDNYFHVPFFSIVRFHPRPRAGGDQFRLYLYLH